MLSRYWHVFSIKQHQCWHLMFDVRHPIVSQLICLHTYNYCAPDIIPFHSNHLSFSNMYALGLFMCVCVRARVIHGTATESKNTHHAFKRFTILFRPLEINQFICIPWDRCCFQYCSVCCCLFFFLFRCLCQCVKLLFLSLRTNTATGKQRPIPFVRICHKYTSKLHRMRNHFVSW